MTGKVEVLFAYVCVWKKEQSKKHEAKEKNK
jgi:hypothetical protein